MDDAAVYALAAAIVVFSFVCAYWANENSALFKLTARCLPLPPSFHATSRLRHVSGGPLKQRPQTFWAFDVLDPLDAVRSTTVPTWVLLMWRITYVLYFIAAFAAQSLADNALPEASYVTYFTNWSMIMMAIVGIVGTVVLSMHLKQDPKEWDFGMKLFVILDQTVPTIALFLSLFYWAVLRDGDMDLDNFMRHGINVFWMFVNVCISRIPFVSYHLIVPILIVGVYCFFMWIYHALSNVWTYEALAPEEAFSVVYYVAVPVLLVVCFYIWFGVVVLRDLATRRCRVHTESNETGKESSANDDQLEMALYQVLGTPDDIEAANGGSSQQPVDSAAPA